MAGFRDIKEWARSFEEYLAYRLRRSQNTVMSYASDLDQYLTFAAKHNLDPLELSTLDLWITELSKNNIRGTSINRKISALRTFGEYLVYDGKLNQNPFSRAKNVKAEERLPHVLSVDEVQQMLNNIDRTTDIGIQDFAMAALFYGTAIRLHTLQGLDIDHVMIDSKGRGEIVVPPHLTKNGQEKRIPLLPFVVEALKMYLPVREKYVKPSERALFVSTRGVRMSTSLIKKRMVRCIRKVSPAGSTHTFRHSCLTHLHDMGVDIRFLQELAGHKTITTTQRYTRVSTTSLRRQLENHPLASMAKMMRRDG